MADKRIIEQNASTTVPDDAFFIFDSALLGTFKISKALMKELLGGGKVIELTKAQYDALPDTKLSDDIIYAIKDQETSYVVDIQVDGNSILDEDGIADLSVISKIEDEIANSIAEEYDSTHTYAYNSWVFHEGTLYRCIGNNVTGTWNATKWQAKTIKEFIDTAKNSVLSTIEQMLGEYLPISTLDPPSIEAISKGDIFIYQRTNKYKFYRAKADHPQGVTEFDIDDWDEFDTVSDLIEDVTEKIDEIEIPVKDVKVKTDSTYDSVVDASGNAKIDLSSVTAYGEVPNLPQAIATFKDGADAPMKSLKVAIEPQQDLHGYDHPWVGGAGKNKFNPSSILQGTYDNTINVWSITIPLVDKAIDMTFKENTQYTFSGKAKQGVAGKNLRLQIVYTDSTKTNLWETNATDEVLFNVTSESGKSISAVNVNFGNAGGTLDITKFQIEEGTTATSYAPYSNICPISGWSGANVSVCGKNLFDKTTIGNGNINDEDGAVQNPTEVYKHTDYIKVVGGESYYIKTSQTKGSWGAWYDKNKNYISGIKRYADSVITAPSNAVYMRLTILNESYVDSFGVNYPSTDTEYHAYNGHTYTIDLDGTRYGGTLDVVNGIFTPAPYYASYNGEALTGEWISDRDKYEAGATPTIGAQVVNIGASGTPVSILPTAVKSLLGQNNIWADTGDINECVYRRDMSSTIDDIIARIEALEG